MAILRIPTGHETAFCYGVWITHVKRLRDRQKKSNNLLIQKTGYKLFLPSQERDETEKSPACRLTVNVRTATDREELLLGTNSGMSNPVYRLPPYLPVCRTVLVTWKILTQSSVLVFTDNNYTPAALNWMASALIILTHVTIHPDISTAPLLAGRDSEAEHTGQTVPFTLPVLAGMAVLVQSTGRCCHFWQACWVTVTGICQMLPTRGPRPSQHTDLHQRSSI